MSEDLADPGAGHVAGLGAELHLDHVTVEVPDLPAAVGQFEEQLGLRVSVSPSAPQRHGRVYLARAYLEVAARPDGPTWDVTHVFLRFSDPQQLRSHLEEAELVYRFQVYEGVDGRWDDVEIDAAGVPMPILVRRTEPAEVARDWPPPLDHPHPGGAFALAAVHIPVASIDAAAPLYSRLLAVEAPRDCTGPEPGPRQAAFQLASGTIVLVEGDQRRAVILGVESLERSRAILGSVLPPAYDGVAWLDPWASSGLAVGFIETPPGHALSRPLCNEP